MGRYSIPLYGIVLVGAMVFGLGVPIGAANMEHFGDLLLITLIYATFISVSLIHIIAGVRGGRSLIDAPTVSRSIAWALIVAVITGWWGHPGAWLGCALHVVADFLGDEHLIRGERVCAKVAGLFVGVAL